VNYYGATDRTISALDGGQNILFLQLRTGRLAGGNSTVACVWEELERNPGIDLDGAIAAAAARIEIDPRELGAQMERPIAVLRRDGILTTRLPSDPPPRLRGIVAGETDQPTRREPADSDQAIPRSIAVVGAVGLAIALLMRMLPFWIQLEILIAIRRARPRRPPLTDTRRLAGAIKRAARYYPGVVECLEQSIAAFIAGALLGAAPDWCHGGSLQNDAYHAWVQSSDTAIDYTNQYQGGSALITMIRLLRNVGVARSPSQPAGVVALHGPSAQEVFRLGPLGHQGPSRASSN
jgi:hypothetical protein